MVIVSRPPRSDRGGGLDLHPAELRQNIVENFAVHVGQTALDAVVIEGETFMVDAKEMKDSSVKVMPGDAVVHGPIAQVIGMAVGHPWF